MDVSRARAWLAANHKPIFAVILALLAGATFKIVASIEDPGGGTHTVTVLVSGQDGKVTVTAPQTAVDQAGTIGKHAGSRSEQPPGVPGPALSAGQEQQERLAANDQLPLVTPDAAPQQAGCASRFVSNYSSRRGVKPRLFVLHYTVSPNRPGWQDVNAITSLFDRASFQASSHYIVDNEGHCAYIVRESDKAWTQAAFNPVSISVEVINSGRESTYAGTAGLAKLARVVSDSTARWQIPLRRGRVTGCTVAAGGIVDHATLGGCGGGHADITPFSTQTVIAAARAYRAATSITTVDRRTCAKLNAWRARGRPAGHQVVVNVRRRQALERRGVVCTSRGPVR